MVVKECSAEGCLRRSRTRGFCEKHYMQFLRHGCTQKDRSVNEYEFEEKICLICLCDRNGNVKAKAIIDIDQCNNIIGKKWRLLPSGYVQACDNTYLHHMINGKPPVGKETDHKNRNKLDNRRSNLRFCFHYENQTNMEARSYGISKYKGVSWDRQHNKWQAGISFNKKRKHLGLYTSEIEAARAFDEAVLRLNPEFGYLNFKGGR